MWGPGWGPMYGWWVMPFFGIIFMVIVLLIVSRFFGGGGFCGRPPADRDSGIEEIKKEIKALREEISDLKNKDKKADWTMNKAVRAVFFLFIFASVAQADDAVKSFVFQTIDGKTIEYQPASGTPMVINVGSHWWPQCKKEAPELQKAYLNYKGKGVGFIGVFAMSGDDDIKKFAETFKITFPVGKENGVAGILGVGGIPVTVFIDRKGRIVKRHIGTVTYADLSADIEAILKWPFLIKGGDF